MFHLEHRISVEIVPIGGELFHVERSATAWERWKRAMFHVEQLELAVFVPKIQAVPRETPPQHVSGPDVPRGTVDWSPKARLVRN